VFDYKKTFQSLYIYLLLAFVFLVMLFIINIPNIFALTCNYDDKPLLTKEINWDCKLDNIGEFKCYTYVLWNNSLISASPIEEDIELYGRVDYFRGEGLVNVYFPKQDLYENMKYTFGVKCASNTTTEEFSAEVVPVYKELREVPYRGIWVKENIIYFIGLFIIIIFLLIIWKMVKG